MNVFLAGASGVIGRPSISILVGRGHRVFAMTRNASLDARIREAGAVPIVLDVFDAARLRSALAAIKPQAVLHQLTDLALLSDSSKLAEALERNARVRRIGTANLVGAAVDAGVEHIVAQSIAWVYRPGPEPYLEQAPLDVGAAGLRAVTVEGVAALERTVLSTAGIRGCVLRYGQLYGPGTGADRPKDIPLHVDAAAWASVLALEKRAAGIYNVAERNPHVSTEKIRTDLGWQDTLRA
jgi:nucleoside-diphosphate-sugar epimerase